MEAVALVCGGDPQRIVSLARLAENTGYRTSLYQDIENWRKHAAHFNVVVVCEPSIGTLEACRLIQLDRARELVVLMPAKAPYDLDALLASGATEVISFANAATELAMHLRTAMARVHKSADPAGQPAVSDGTLHLDGTCNDAFHCGRPLGLTDLGFGLLRFLHNNQGRICKVERIVEEVWGSKNGATRHTVAVCISRIRERFAAVGLASPIQCIHRKGYRYVPAGTHSPHGIVDRVAVIEVLPEPSPQADGNFCKELENGEAETEHVV